MSELTGAIRIALLDASPAKGQSRYFGTPLRAQSGPLNGRFITLYRGGRDPDVQELLMRRHAAYIDCLRLAGLRVPETEMRLLDDAGTLRPVIVQEAVPEDMMLDVLLRRAGQDAALVLLDQVATNVAEFWRRVAQRPERIGLHAQVGRFGVDQDGPLFLDTFPPLISYDRDEMGRLIQRFADSGLIRGIGKILPGRGRDAQDRWYSQAGSITTLLDGALRLRAQDSAAILEWAEGFADRRLEGPWRAAVQAHVNRQRQQAAKGRSGWRPFGGRERPHA